MIRFIILTGMASHVENIPLKVHYPLSPTSSICSERSTPSPDSGLECHQSPSSDSNFLQLRSEHQIRRKISTSSEASYVSTNLSHDGGFSDTPDELTTPSNIDDEILEKFDGLECSSGNVDIDLDQPEITVKIVNVKQEREDAQNDDDDDDDLLERGPDSKAKHCRKKPYESCSDWLQSMQSQAYSPELDSSAQQILSDPQLRDKITLCLDQLADANEGQRTCVNSEWIDTAANGHVNSHSDERSIAFIPSIILHNDCLPNEEQLMFFDLEKFQAAQPDKHNPNPSPAASSDWPDSPVSSYNVLSSRSHSRASSRAQSPGCLGNIGSPIMPISLSGSPPQHRLTPYRQPRPQSSSSSSNYSFGDTPSPMNYLNSIERRTEDQLGMRFGNIKTCESCESSSTIVNSDDISCRIQMMNEVIGDNREQDEMQVVPKFQNDSMTCRMPNKNFERTNYTCPNPMFSNHVSSLESTGLLINSAQNNLIYTDYDYGFHQNITTNLQESRNNEQHFTTPEAVIDFVTELEDMAVQSYNSQTITESQLFLAPSPEAHKIPDSDLNYNIRHSDIRHITSPQYEVQQRFNNSDRPPTSTFNNFPIPKPVSQYRSSNSRRNSFRKVSPWPSLNLPATSASETLKAQVDPEEVEKAMRNILKKSNTELMKTDDDGYTGLMCLVANPVELEMQKAYLAPLVERLGQIPNGLSKINNRGEDALYLAAMNCPQLPHIAGYLAAAMLQKGIDISQRLYQTRGDTLIHAIAVHGETHKLVLAELLALKTMQGNSVFDLSKRNYDGRTPLHVAVESHDPSGTNNSISTVRLLLENGADPKVKETKCGNTALHLAVSLSSDPNLIKMLLSKNGCDAVNIFNRNRNTPLHMVAAMSDRLSLEVQKDICLNLIKAGGLTNITNGQGKTPLALVSFERKDLIRNIFQRRDLHFA